MKQTLDWQQYLSLAATASAEGIVMLRNEQHALPIPADEEVAVFGRMQFHYYKSGTGSGGMVNVSKVTGILDGMLEAGVHIYDPLRTAYAEWDAKNPFDQGDHWGGEPWSQKEMPLDTALVQAAAAACRRAIVILARTAGEEQDHKAEKGSYYLTDAELAMLRQVRDAFETVIVLLNTGNIIDLKWTDSCMPDALLLVWQGGMTGGIGVADVLTGAVSPCGKLPDTIANELSDYPAYQHFGGQDENLYTEDIYVGYRYFETFARSKVRYPFGFGLSYTSFSIFTGGLQTSDTPFHYTIPVVVTNTGDFPGKEVVQIYCEAPQGLLGKPLRVLCGYAKTETIPPHASQTLHIPASLPPSYDDSGMTGYAHSWVLEPGTYKFYVGTDVRSAQHTAGVVVENLRIVESCRQALPPVQAFQRIKPVSMGRGYLAVQEDVPRLSHDEEARIQKGLPKEIPHNACSSKLWDVADGKVTLEEFVGQFSDEELMCIVRGEGMGSPRVTVGTASAFGGVTDALEAYGIPAGCCSDGPSGMRLDCGTKAFSLPNGTMLAATFNCALLTELFACVGLEMAANHVDCLLGPGMNIHRHPLNGRNFEYFSEDPYLTGTIASAELQGLHQSGVTGTIKHCCGNNQETNRHFLNTVASERALREIYLMGFEIAVTEGKADSIMTTYGAVNGLWTAGNYDLCTEILRSEWGFEGIVMTDWWANINRRGKEPDKKDLAAMVRAQNDLYMVCADVPNHEDNLAEALKEGTLTRAELQRSAMNICRFLMHTRAMKRMRGREDEVEILNRPAEEMPQTEPVIFHDAGEDFTLDLRNISTERGTSYAFALNMKAPGWYHLTLSASSEQGPLAQMPVTLFSMGTASGTFTWNGTDGKIVSFTKKLPLFSRFMTMRLYFAQSGLKMEVLHIQRIAGQGNVEGGFSQLDEESEKAGAEEPKNETE